jgi:hypothetical protein
MEVLLGFGIAALIAMTGVGAGTITAPLLILFLHLPVEAAVGTALAYSAAVKLVVVPVQIWRKQVIWRTLAVMLVTGIPGVAIGSLIFKRITLNPGNTLWLFLALGGMIVTSSGWHIYRHFRPATVRTDRPSRPGWLALAMLPVGAEVGIRPLPVAGWRNDASEPWRTGFRVAHEPDRWRHPRRDRRHGPSVAHSCSDHAPRALALALRHGSTTLLPGFPAST